MVEVLEDLESVLRFLDFFVLHFENELAEKLRFSLKNKSLL